MAKKAKIDYKLSDVANLPPLAENEIKSILRAADDIVSLAGRTMLAKVLKGSKDKKLMEKKLDHCPAYGYYNDYSIEEITKKIDWMIVKGYLQIDYKGRLPIIFFTGKGWNNYKPVYVEELYELLLNSSRETYREKIEKLKQTNREVVIMLLDKIGESRNIGFIRILNEWKLSEVKKVKLMINSTIAKLKTV